MIKNKAFCIMSILCICFTAFMFSACSQGLDTFSISGQVICGDNAIQGAVVKSDLVTDSVITDENGIFMFLDLTGSTKISVEAEGYYFKTKSQIASKKTGNMVFEALKYYTLSGRVESNNIGIAGASVSVAGEITATAITDSNGIFMIPNLAGDVVVNVEKEGYLFETKTANIDTQNLVISSSTSISAVINDVENTAEVCVKVNNTDMTLKNNKYVAENVMLGSVVTPIANGYHFEPSSITVTRENQELTFTAYKIYTLTGVTKSGDYKIANVTVKVGQRSVKSDANGEFTLDGLYGESVVTFSHSVFSFANQVVNKETCENLEAVGGFTLTGTVICGTEYISNIDVVLNENKFTQTSINGTFTFTNAKIGDKISFISDEYCIAERNVENVFEMLITAEKYYDLQVKITEDTSPLYNVCLKIDDKNYYSNERGIINITKLLGANSGEITLQGYRSQTISFDEDNKELNINLQKYFDIEIYAHSGNILLNQAKIYVGQNLVTLDTSTGKAVLKNYFEQVEISAECSGYNELATQVANKNNTFIEFDFDYQVSGLVANGDAPLEQVDIKATNSNSQTVSTKTAENGTFSLVLKGNCEITANMAGLEFFDKSRWQKGQDNSSCKSILVQDECEADFLAIYKISGVLTREGEGGQDEAISNAEVILSNGSSNGNDLVAYTDSNGKYEFTELQGEMLLYTTYKETSLYPAQYVVSSSGDNYNFNANGYSVSGKILCGDVGVAGVTVTAIGENFMTKSTTDASGNFEFALLMGEVNVSASKNGYTFDNTYTLTRSDKNRTDIDFNSTYSIRGVIVSGGVNVSGVEVRVGEDKVLTTDESGAFEFAGLVGQNSLKLNKQGYTFDNLTSVSGYVDLSVNASVKVAGIATTGQIKVANASVCYGNKIVLTDINGEFIINDAQLGQEITIVKQGYTFANSYTIEEYSQEPIGFDGTYSVLGKIKSNTGVLANVVVSYLDKIVSTDEYGEFTISGLNTEVELSFACAGYTFLPRLVSGYENIEVKFDTFEVQGAITIGQKGLSGVEVSSSEGGLSAVADENGQFKITGLTQNGYLTLSLEGYEFAGKTAYKDASTLNFTSTYGIKVNAICGSLGVLQDYTINISTTDASAEVIYNSSENYYLIRGLTSSVEVEANCENYNSATKIFENYVAGVQSLNLNYDVIINLDAELSNFAIEYTSDNKNETITASGKTVVLTELQGSGKAKISKENYKFFIDGKGYDVLEINYTKNRTVNITYQPVYSVSGRITYKNTSTPIIGAIVECGSNRVYTDSQGNYKLIGLLGTNTITSYLPNLDGIDKTDTAIATTQVSGQTNACNFTCNNEKYQLWLVLNAYNNLRNAPGYKCLSTGVVKGVAALGITTTQNAYGVRMKDKDNRYYIENKNYGGKVAGVDPKVSLTAYYNPSKNSNLVVYLQNQKVDENYNSTYSEGEWNTASKDSYSGTYGGLPNGLYPYIINASTVTGYDSGFGLVDNQFVFKITLNKDSATVNYRKQILKLSGQNATFNEDVQLTFTIGNDGNIKNLKTHEVYDAGGLATCTANLEENFEITDGNELLNDKLMQANYCLPDNLKAQI